MNKTVYVPSYFQPIYKEVTVKIGSPNDVMLKRPLRDPIFAAAFSTAVRYAHLNCRGPMLMPICSHFCPGLSTSVLSTQMAALRLGISVRHFRV
ncbi:hypothetical protein AE576_22345 [Salmonella enterica subsp. enterica serovar Kentucky]|nr:hypothetical protein [Salmonella enterica subsp. enterica serovar Kentucky]EDG7668052.1 hypothetical protein [Salmonella enterica subsp. enterica serovar Kentucky]